MVPSPLALTLVPAPVAEPVQAPASPEPVSVPAPIAEAEVRRVAKQDPAVHDY
jgi:hypothetical protein